MVSIASKLPSHVILHRESGTPDRWMRQNQTGLLSGNVCILQIFFLRRMFHKLSDSKFLGLESAYDSVDQAVLWPCLSLKDVTEI